MSDIVTGDSNVGIPTSSSAQHHGRTRYAPPSDAALALADGVVYRGTGFGAEADAAGEVVFTTTMVGYQEVSTDPSFRGQIVCMTYPLIGNYGIQPDQNESRQPWIAGLVVREHCLAPSHAGSTGTIDDFLRGNGIPGISGIDTRSLTLHIREVGDTRGVIVRDVEGVPDEVLVERAKAAPLPGEFDAVAEVIRSTPEELGPESGPHVVVIDCGVKRNIIRSLVKRGVRVTIVPFGTSLQEIERLAPDGVVMSPGPGDPASLDSGQEVVTGVIDRGIPYFGICLGHQLLARSIGAETRKLKFGHRGGNHPVRDLHTGAVTITSQNHGFEVDASTVPVSAGWEVRLVNLNDGSVEGLAHKKFPVMSVQFHPESSPGPQDNDHLFDDFIGLIRETGGGHGSGSRVRQ
jgi:carbamoyl-phosphate synthase small subunit